MVKASMPGQCPPLLQLCHDCRALEAIFQAYKPSRGLPRLPCVFDPAFAVKARATLPVMSLIPPRLPPSCDPLQVEPVGNDRVCFVLFSFFFFIIFI